MHTRRETVDRRSVERVNGLADDEAAAELRACCAAASWVEAMTAGRPYPDLDAMLEASASLVAGLDDAALEQALAAHARIGERRGGESAEDVWSRAEQAGVLAGDHELAARLAEGNRAYERRFGRVFLIRAAGRSAQEMYDAQRTRLGHDDATERAVVLDELAEIVALRLTRLVGR